MADIRPFPGVRFDPARAGLGGALCPPYDAISAESARQLRKSAFNAIHLELPQGQGAAKYRHSAGLWKKWSQSGLLLEDAPSYYVCEQSFRLGGKTLRRLGFLAAMGVSEAAARQVVRHEKTLSKPKADRLRLLQATRVNISPIFGIFPDSRAAVRRALKAAARQKPAARGRAMGVDFKLWRLAEPELVQKISRALKSKNILIADGHHRYEVSRRYYARHPLPEASSVLIYLCPEEDSGLVVLPTHRVVKKETLSGLSACKISECRTLEECLRKLASSPNPYAFGVFSESRFRLSEPRGPGGCRSGLCVEWLSRNLLGDTPPDQIGYTPEAEKAVKLARAAKGAALLVKPMRVPQIRQAVAAIGLLPQKSTYFYPKIATGLVFKPVYSRNRR